MPYASSSGDEVGKSSPKVKQGGGDVEKWSHFKKPSSPSVLEELGKKSFALSTEREIRWAVDLYKNWRWSCISVSAPEVDVREGDIDGLNLSKSCLASCLCKFLNEIKRKDGNEFAGKGLYNIVILIQFHLERHGFMWKLVEDPEFKTVRFTVDNLMKQRCADWVSMCTSATVISMSDEDKMWRDGVLGKDEPVKLRNTVMYLLGVACALRGGQEQRDLRAPGFDPQVKVCEEEGVEFLWYTEDGKSKTNQGGLSGRKHVPKSVKVPANPDFDRDLVRLYKKYVGLLPRNSKTSALYRYPLQPHRCTPCQWFSDKPIRVNCLKKIVSSLTKQAGLTGKFTNHSLRATAATRMYTSGIDEQVIKEITGHKSDSVWMYKRTDEKLLKEASISLMCKRKHVEGEVEVANVKVETEKANVKVETEKIGDKVFTLGPRGLSIHARACGVDKCSDKCEILKKIDKTVDKKRLKKMKLSLKYCKK